MCTGRTGRTGRIGHSALLWAFSFLLVADLGCSAQASPDSEAQEESEAEEGPGDPASTCDPLVQDCGGNLACSLILQHFECTEAGSSSFGENCVYPFDCEIGLVCGAYVFGGCDSGFGCCTSYCEPGEGGCPETMTCAPLFDGAPSPGVGPVGFCVPAG